jgi:hypothetical protein
VSDTLAYRHCTICGKEKPFEAFNKFKPGKQGRRAACKVCMNAIAQERAQQYPKRQVTHKICAVCKVNLPVEEFYKSTQHIDGHRPWCRGCTRAYNKTHHRTKGKEKQTTVRARTLKKLYNLTIDDYQRMWDAQGGACKMCSRPETNVNPNGTVRTLCVDHCHTTGKVRGLLCGNCNVAIGLLQENVATLARGIQYLQGTL